MTDKCNFNRFGSIIQAELLDEQQMNTIEAGGKCESGCKKSCYAGNQNGNKPMKIEDEDSNQMPVIDYDEYCDKKNLIRSC